MLDDLDRSLRALLLDELPRVVERIEVGGFDITFEVPNRENTARLTRPTVNLFLFHVQENRVLRPGPWQSIRVNGGVRDERPPVRLECHYLITAWSNQVEDEHRLLTGAARAFFRNQHLPEGVLQGTLANTPFELPVMVGQPAQLKDVVDIWSVLDNDLKPSVRVNVIVPLELDVGAEGPLATERRLVMPPPTTLVDPRRRVDVVGRLDREGAPLSGAQVRMHQSSATTRGDGTFELRNVPAGTRGVLVAVGGDIYRLDADPPAGETPEGELLALELTSARAAGDGAASNGSADGGDASESSEEG
jgi:hypothetical protein